MDSMQGMRVPDVERWSERVVVVRGLNPGPFTGPGTNTYLVGTGRDPILLDTGDGRADYVPLLERALREECNTSAPGQIALTHVHPDHIGGAAAVLKHFGDMPVAKLPWPGKDERFGLELRPLAEGDRITTDGATLRAIHTPGHARDHLCFYLEEERALFTGDVIVGAGTVVIPLDGGNMATYLNTLERLLDLEIRLIYPGHGPRIEAPYDKIREYIAHRKLRERQIVDAAQGGANTIENIVTMIYVDTPKYLHAAAGQSVLAHLIKLESEGRAVRRIDAAGQEHWTVG